jgi:hypothetical protein
MEAHVKVLGWLNLMFGGLGVLLSFAVLGGIVAVSSLFGIGGEEALLPIHIIAIVGGIITLFTLLLSLPALLLGYGLLNLRPWARILGLVMSGLSLFHIPIGTALALYSFWVLLKPETEALFRQG